MSKVLQCTLTSLAILMSAENALVRAQTEAPSSDAGAAVAGRTEQAPRLDGTLDDPIWQIALPINDFRQRGPLETAPATEKTEVRILYDACHVYFGIHLLRHSPRPDRGHAVAPRSIHRGKPVAELVPVDNASREFLGRLKDVIRIVGDIESPVEAPEAWESFR